MKFYEVSLLRKAMENLGIVAGVGARGTAVTGAGDAIASLREHVGARGNQNPSPDLTRE